MNAMVPRVEAFCHRKGWLDMPGPRKIHTHPTPRLTGIVLFATIWAPIAGAAVFAPDLIVETRFQLIPLFAGAVVILALGIIDDLHSLPGWMKLAGQVLVGSGLIWAGIGFDRIWIPFVGGVELGFWAWPVTLSWFLILCNAINIIDGLDGLAVSTTAIATISVIWVSWIHNLPAIWLGGAGLCGGLAVFWRFNRSPARVFMGDSGSLSLGYFFAVVALLAPIKRFTVVAFFLPVIVLFVPLFESAVSIARRSLGGVNPLSPDRGHLHHRLLRAGWSARRVVRVYSMITVVFAGFSVLLPYANHRWVAAGIGIFVLFITVILTIFLRRQMPSTEGRRNDAGDKD